MWTTFQIKLALRIRVFGVYHVMKDAVECDRTGNLSSTIGGRLAATGCRRPPYLEPAFLDLNDGSKEMDDLILTSYIIRSAAQPTGHFRSCALLHPHQMWEVLEASLNGGGYDAFQVERMVRSGIW